MTKKHSCPCGEANPKNFYGHKKNRCSKCHNSDVIARGNLAKDFIVDHFKGKCQICGYVGFNEAFDVHHLDPKIKDKNFASMRGWCKERLLKELEGCILLCAICHRGVHAGKLTISG